LKTILELTGKDFKRAMVTVHQRASINKFEINERKKGKPQ
jgi:hypothetical protein